MVRTPTMQPAVACLTRIPNLHCPTAPSQRAGVQPNKVDRPQRRSSQFVLFCEGLRVAWYVALVLFPLAMIVLLLSLIAK